MIKMICDQAVWSLYVVPVSDHLTTIIDLTGLSKLSL